MILVMAQATVSAEDKVLVQSWHEHPGNPHLVSKNASQTEPAKLLVFLLSQEGESIKAPIK